MTDYKNELEQIRNDIFDLAYDHETEKRITHQTANIMTAIEALLSKRELEAYKKGYIDGGISQLTNREEK